MMHQSWQDYMKHDAVQLGLLLVWSASLDSFCLQFTACGKELYSIKDVQKISHKADIDQRVAELII